MGQGTLSPPRVVVDTGVVVSALVFSSGRLAWLRAAWRDGQLVPLVSRDTASELLRVLAYPKFRLSADEQRTLLGDSLPWCEAVTVPARQRGIPRCRDPFDRPFLALAYAAGADALVTGNDDLLTLAPQSRVPIVSPAGLREAIPSSE